MTRIRMENQRLTTTPKPGAREERPAPRSRRRRVRRAALGASPAVVVACWSPFHGRPLGPCCESGRARGSNYLERPMHIGRISAQLVPGVFVFDDLVIEG